MTESPILSYPDFGMLFTLDTDASHVGTGVVLFHVKDGLEKLIEGTPKCV